MICHRETQDRRPLRTPDQSLGAAGGCDGRGGRRCCCRRLLFAGLAAIAAVIVAWIKREEWTLPAYRWTKDKTGRWSITPWSSQSTRLRARRPTVA